MPIFGMRRSTFAGIVLIAIIVVVVGRRMQEPSRTERVTEGGVSEIGVSEIGEAAAIHGSFLYGRVMTTQGEIYEGRLRWGGGEEAFWDHYFNGSKGQNPWAASAPAEQITERRTFSILGFDIAERSRQIDLGRPFMARFGDIARLEANGSDLWVELKNGTVHRLDRYEADDLADGLRIWDLRIRNQPRIVDLGESTIRSVELFNAPSSHPPGEAPGRLHGTVQTRQGEFVGFLQWGREKSLGTDTLDGRGAEGELSLPFRTIRSIEKSSSTGCLVTNVEGRRLELSGGLSRGRRGIYVEDRRFGRVLVSWDAFERVVFSDLGTERSSGPGYDDFPPGQPLLGRVTTHAGERLSGRLVYDLDESETTETLDAPFQGVNYTLPFGRIASIERSADPETLVRVTLRGSETNDSAAHGSETHGAEILELERSGDLSDRNVGLLVFKGGRETADFVPWDAVRRIDFERQAPVD